MLSTHKFFFVLFKAKWLDFAQLHNLVFWLIELKKKIFADGAEIVRMKKGEEKKNNKHQHERDFFFVFVVSLPILLVEFFLI